VAEGKVELVEADYTTKVPYGFKGEKITIAQMVETPEFKSLEPIFASRILQMVREKPTFGILKGGGDRPEPEVRALFYRNYKQISGDVDYEKDNKKYEEIKSGKIKWNPEDGKWYARRPGKSTAAVPGASWHTGGYAVDITGNISDAAKLAKKYQVEQVIGTGETHHFQPAGVPDSKRMFLELKNTYGIDAIKTPLSPDILLFINKEIASNVPRHPQRIKKVLDAAIDKFKRDSGSDDDKSLISIVTDFGRKESGTKISWGDVGTVTPKRVAAAVKVDPVKSKADVFKNTPPGFDPRPVASRPRVGSPPTTTTTTTQPPTTTTISQPAPTTTQRASTSQAATTTTSPPNRIIPPPAPVPTFPSTTATPTTTTAPPVSTTVAPTTTLKPLTPTTVRPVPTSIPPTSSSTSTSSSTTSTTMAPKATTTPTNLTVDNKPVSQEERILIGISDTSKTLTAREIKAVRDSRARAVPTVPTAPPASTNTGSNVSSTGKPTNPKKGDTYTNSKKVNFTWNGKSWVRTATLNKGPDTTSEAWKTTIQEEFGSLWDVYNDNGDVKKVIDQSVKEGWFNDSVKLTESLRNTNWFRTTESSARQYTISQSTDPATAEATLNKRVEEIRAQSLNSGVSLSEATLRDLGERSLKFGWTEQQVANGVGSEAVATANRGGTAGVADLRRGSTGTELRGIADNYGIKVSDTMLDEYVAKILQGTTTKVQFTDQMKNQASTMYRSLAPQIEKGMDVKTATSMYTNTAASVLGVDPSTVDWTQDKWNKALNYQDPKTNEYRQMDSYEWNRYLRSLPEWQETDDAKSTYRRAAFTLAQAFGKTS
jgi:hypothetical protein